MIGLDAVLVATMKRWVSHEHLDDVILVTSERNEKMVEKDDKVWDVCYADSW